MVWVGADPRARRSFSLPSVDRQRLRLKAVSMLGTLGLAGSARFSGSHKYATLSVEEMMKGNNDDRAKNEALSGVGAATKRSVKPRTPTLTPPNEPEVINAWELMAGLEDADALTPRAVHQSLSFDESLRGWVVEVPTMQPQWMQDDMDMPPFALEFDPEILSGFREALEDTPPSQPTVISSAEEELEPPTQKERKSSKDADASCDTPMSPAASDMPELSGIVRARINAFQERIERRRSKGRDAKVSPLRPPGGERKAVVYFTSLRGVRKTFVDCCAVRSILRSYGVSVDERDVSMHAVFKAELAKLLGAAGAALPRVFVDGQYVGGAEDVHYLHEAGELGRALDGCDAAPTRKLGYMEACAACGDVRFVPCETCCGSCKVFVEDDDAGEFRRCPDCNENGLVRCPVCCC
jgi:glutaredoxin